MALTVTDPAADRTSRGNPHPEALAFVEELHRRFAGTRAELLAARVVKRERGGPDRHASTSCPKPPDVRDGDWKVAPAPPRCRTAVSR